MELHTMADTVPNPVSKPAGKVSGFIQKHKTAFIVATIVLVVLVVYVLYRNRQNAGSSSAYTSNTPAGPDSNVPGNLPYNTSSLQGPAGPQGAPGPRGKRGPPGKIPKPIPHRHHRVAVPPHREHPATTLANSNRNAFYTVKPGETLTSV